MLEESSKTPSRGIIGHVAGQSAMLEIIAVKLTGRDNKAGSEG